MNMLFKYKLFFAHTQLRQADLTDAVYKHVGHSVHRSSPPWQSTVAVHRSSPPCQSTVAVHRVSPL